jgi:hypothetical protein
MSVLKRSVVCSSFVDSFKSMLKGKKSRDATPKKSTRYLINIRNFEYVKYERTPIVSVDS